MRNGAMNALPKSLLKSLEQGELTLEQLKELIALEAHALGLEYDEAIKRAKERTLPRNHIGADLELLVELLPA
jgi:hypothetical protein